MCVFSNWKLNLISMKISTRFCVYVVKHVANWFAVQILEAACLNETLWTDFCAQKRRTWFLDVLPCVHWRQRAILGLISKALLVLLQPLMPVALKSKKPRGQERRLSRPVAWVLWGKALCWQGGKQELGSGLWCLPVLSVGGQCFAGLCMMLMRSEKYLKQSFSKCLACCWLWAIVGFGQCLGSIFYAHFTWLCMQNWGTKKHVRLSVSKSVINLHMVNAASLAVIILSSTRKFNIPSSQMATK